MYNFFFLMKVISLFGFSELGNILTVDKCKYTKCFLKCHFDKKV